MNLFDQGLLETPFGWTAAFGIMVTVVWLYLEILRLLSYFMPRS